MWGRLLFLLAGIGLFTMLCCTLIVLIFIFSIWG